MFEALARRLQMSVEDLRHAVTLSGILFAITSSYTLVKTARDALFLAQLPATSLPYVYLGVGVVTLGASFVFGRLTARAQTWETLAGTALVAALALAGFAWLVPFGLEWVPIAFYLWVNIYGLILVSQFWNFTNSVSDSRQAKRIFGIVGGGGILGGLVGGLLAARLGAETGLSSLIVVAAVLVAFAVPSVYQSVRQGTLPPPEPSPPVESETRPWKSRYIRWLALATLCSVLVTGLLDYQFKVEAQSRFTTQDALTRFFGTFYTVMNLIALTFQLFGTRWMLQKLGAGWSAAVLPSGLGIGAAVTLGAPGLASVFATRLWEQVTRHSINRSAVELFYFPVEPNLRRRAKAMIDSGLERVGDGLAGLMILGLGVTLGTSTWTLALVVLLLVLVWIAAWIPVRAGYVRELGRNLRRLNLDPGENRVSLREASLRGEMRRLLASPYERVVLHGLAMLEDNDPRALRQHLAPLMEHASARVRARALALASVHDPAGAQAHVERLMADPDPFVRIEALRVMAARGKGRPYEALESYLRAEDPGIRRAALECLMELAPADDEDRLEAHVERVLADGAPEDRAAAAAALGRRRAPSALHAMVRPLLHDPDLEVRRAAMRAVGQAQLRVHIPMLIESLGERSLRDAAIEGLASMGDKVVGTLGDYVSDPSVPIELRREIARTLGEIATQEAVNALFRSRDRGDVLLAYRILKAANRIRVSRPQVTFPAPLVNEDVAYDAAAYLFALVHYRTCPLGAPRSAERLLCIALNERMEQALNRIFRRLALIHPHRNVYAAWRGLHTADARQRANALEYLDNVLTPEQRTLVLPLLADTSDEEKLAFAAEQFGLKPTDQAASLRAFLEGDDPWLKTIALHIVGARRDAALRPLVEAQLDATDPRVRETALWAHAAFAGT